MDRLVGEYSVEVVRADDVTVTRFAVKAHVGRVRAKEILEQLADAGRLVRVTVRDIRNGREFTAYREK